MKKNTQVHLRKIMLFVSFLIAKKNWYHLQGHSIWQNLSSKKKTSEAVYGLFIKSFELYKFEKK